MYLGQGGAIIVAGAAAAHYPPVDVIAVSGGLGVVAALALAISGYKKT
jgi:hypothetical protein